MEEPKDFTFELTKSFKYAFKGEQRDAQFISLFPPTMRQHSQASDLKQSINNIVAKAVEDAGVEGSEDDDDDDDDDDKEGIAAKQVVSLIYVSTCIKANVVWEQAKALFKEGVALVDGEQKLTKPLIEKMDPSDFEKLVGEYVANFILV